MNFIRVIKASDWTVERRHSWDTEDGKEYYYIWGPDGEYCDADGEPYRFDTREDALEEVEYLRAEHKFDKHSSNTIDLDKMKEIDMINCLVEYFNDVYKGYGWVMPDKLSVDLANGKCSEMFEGMTDEELVKFVKEYNLADIYRFKNLPEDEQAKLIEEDGEFNPEDIILKPTHINYIREVNDYLEED